MENSVTEFWEGEFERRGARYRDAMFTTFTGRVSTAWGTASSQVGPFYCPADLGVYIDLGFFEVLQSRLGAQGVTSPRPTWSHTSSATTFRT